VLPLVIVIGVFAVKTNFESLGFAALAVIVISSSVDVF
jgi:hypothetical protein